jgi:hypothetical protein
MIPIAGVTHSGIQFFTWTQRFIRHLALEGYEDGWAFRRMDGTRAKASDYQDNIFRKLEIVQATTTLIDPVDAVSGMSTASKGQDGVSSLPDALT